MKALNIILKSLATLVLFGAFVFAVTSVSPIFDFEAPSAFHGPDIFNPYKDIDSTVGWKRANFHTHTKVDHILNECPGYPDVVYDDYKKLGYDILTFSNHNELTTHPYDSSLQVNVYEHGINLFKFHKHVWNPSRVLLWDPLLPLFISQKQWEYDYLGRNSDFISMNHPDRTNHTTKKSMQVLTGYRIMEADSGVSTELLHWDEALSAGHYSFCYLNDDNHDSKRSGRTGVRCTWINSPSGQYDDLKATLLSGRYYSMRVPDFGDGDWEVKYQQNSRLPYVKDIGIRGDTTFIKLSCDASSIEVTGQDHKLCKSVNDSCMLSYVMTDKDPYLRYTARFDNGVIIYSNAFARYDKSSSDSPYRYSEHPVNVLLTVLFNLIILLIAAGCVYLGIILYSKKL